MKAQPYSRARVMTSRFRNGSVNRWRDMVEAVKSFGTRQLAYVLWAKLCEDGHIEESRIAYSLYLRLKKAA